MIYIKPQYRKVLIEAGFNLDEDAIFEMSHYIKRLSIDNAIMTMGLGEDPELKRVDAIRYLKSAGYGELIYGK